MTMTDAQNVLGEATVGELQAAVRGQVIRPGDSNYDEARAVWNAAHDKHPALIVRCTGAADVIKAVSSPAARACRSRYAAARTASPASRPCDGGVVLDLSPMKAVTVDPQRRRAVAQGGATWADFDHETQAFGLAIDRRPGLHHRARRIHARRGYRLAAAQARPDLRQPRLRRCGHRRRPAASMPAPSRTATCSGRCAVAAATSALSRRWSSRCIRSVPPSSVGWSSSRATRARTGADRLARARRVDARRADLAGRPHHRPAGSVPARIGARQADRGRRRDLLRSAGRRRRRRAPAAHTRASRSPTCSDPCPMPRCSRFSTRYGRRVRTTTSPPR